MTGESVDKLMRNPREEVAFGTGYLLRGITLKFKETTVLMMVKVTGTFHDNRIAFIECATAYDCWCFLASACYTTSVKLDWRQDKW
jgi:hypothetical protein